MDRSRVTGFGRPRLVFAALLVVAACADQGPSDRPPAALLVSDRALGPGAALDLTLRNSFDGYVVEFGEIGAVLSDASGRIYVADVMAREIGVLDQDGGRVGTIGGPGDGPCEFRGLAPTLAWMGELLVGLDQPRQRFVYFSRDGACGGSIGLPETFIRAGTTVFSGESGSAFARILVSPPAPARPTPASEEAMASAMANASPTPAPLVHYATISSEGVRLLLGVSDTPLRPTVVNCRRTDGSGISDIFPLPFADWGPLQTVAPTGSVAIASREAFRVDVIDPETGQTVATRQRDVPSLPVEDEDWNSHPSVEWLRTVEQETNGRLTSDRDPGQPCEMYEARPQFFPAIRGIIADNRGRLWVDAVGIDGFELTLFDSDGTIVGMAAMPTRDLEVAPHARDDFLYLVTKDSLDVQSIAVYELGLRVN